MPRGTLRQAPMTAATPASGHTPSPPVARRRAARQVRQMRLNARLTLDEAAPKLDLTRSSLNRVETGATQLDVHLARSMMDVYDEFVPELLDTVRAARLRGWWHNYLVGNSEYLGWEAGATQVRELAAARLPDLLQTEDYTRALLSDLHNETPKPRARRDAVRRRMADELQTRRIRQRRLLGQDTVLSLTVIVDEAALHHQVGGFRVMRAQLAQVIEFASLTTVRLHVLPFSAGATFRIGGFRLLTFDHRDDPPLVYVDQLSEAVREEATDQIAAATQIFHYLTSAALTESESRRFVEKIRDEMTSA